jgi:hypothetical protein
MALDANGVQSCFNELNKTVILKFLSTVVKMIIAIIHSRVNTVSVPNYMAQIDGYTVPAVIRLFYQNKAKQHPVTNSQRYFSTHLLTEVAIA